MSSINHHASDQPPKPIVAPGARDPRLIPLQSSYGSEPVDLSPSEERAVDVAQDNDMASSSVDGRPPTHRQRAVGWLALLVVVPLVIAGAIAWALAADISPLVIVGASGVFAVTLMVAGLPVWLAGLSRGKEEAIARRKVLKRMHPDHAAQANPAATSAPRQNV